MFSQNGLFLDYLFAGNRLLELSLSDTIHKKRRKKNGGLMRGRFHIKTTQIPPFFCCIPVFQSFLSLHIPLSFANFFTLAKKISRSVDHRCIFIFISILWVFICIKGYPSSDSGLSIENFLKRVQSRRWKGAKGKIAYASRVRVVFISRIFIHTVRKRQFEKQDWTEAGATKWRAFF